MKNKTAGDKFSLKRKLGNIGEGVAETFLMKNGHKILDKNYLRKWGELDLITEKDGLMRFIEVKSKTIRGTQNYAVTRENDQGIFSQLISRFGFTQNNFKIEVSRETSGQESDEYLPEDNIHYWKQKRMLRTIQTYLFDKNIDEDMEWQVDVIVVSIDFQKKRAIIKHIENVVFDV